eukprot:14761-Heterococcus_DN1.PRE.2
MISSGAARKGSTVLTEVPTAVFQTQANRSEALVCDCCHGFPDELQLQISLLQGCSRKQIAQSSKRITACALQCDWYCSTACRDAALQRGHRMLCLGTSSSARSVQEFRRHALRTSETFLFGAALFAEAVSYSTSSEQQHDQNRLDAITMLCMQQPVRMWWDIVSNTAEQSEGAQQLVAESWCLLKPLLLVSDNYAAAQCVLPLTLDSYAAMLGQLELQLLPLQLENPLVSYCTSLLTATATEKASALQQLAAIVPDAVPVTSSCADTQSAATVQTERAIAKLVQAAGDPAVCPFPPFSAVAVLLSIGTVAHSCIPNVQLEAEHDSTTAKQLIAKLVALRDITADEPLTVARIPVNQPYAQRRAELRRVLRDEQYVCQCDRCIWEQHSTAASSTQQLPFSAQQYITLAQQFLEESRHSDALQLYKRALQCEPCCGDALHGVGVAYLASGDWTAAHTAWQTGVQLAPQHSALAAQACKDAAYELAHSTAAVATASDSATGAYEAYEGQVYMTSVPVLTAAECTSVIDAVEAQAAASKGWTTSRHYAVPTTDLPVHSIPSLKDWFCTLLRDRLFPLLTKQFCTSRTSTCSCAHSSSSSSSSNVKWCVHDAFVVKYSHEAQRHLPVHADQSTHSLTIALNGSDCFEGGGTFFVHLDKALKPEAGHVLSFNGNLLHEDSDVQCNDCIRKHQLDTANDATADACKKLRTAAEPLQWQQSDAMSFAFAFDDDDIS